MLNPFPMALTSNDPDYSVSVPVPDGAAEWIQRLIDVVAVRLTGFVLSDPSNQAAVEMFRKSGGDQDERVRLLAVLIAQLPEANLR